MSKTAVIGAGKTGRGFIGRLLFEAGEEIMFVDKDEALVNDLMREGGFTVSFFGKCRDDVTVSGYTACTWDNADFSDVSLIIVSVGGTNLPDVGASLKSRINDGKMRHIIVAENAKRPAKVLGDALGLDIKIAESTVFCTTIENGGININSENYPYLQYDADALGTDTGIATLKGVSGFGNFLTRKLFTYNAASCVIAYLGFAKGYTDYGEAANDEEILALLDRNYAATNGVLCEVFGYDKADQQEFAALSKRKFCDRTIADTVARNAREPQRKLQSGERIMGPLVLMHEKGADVSVLVLTAAAMLIYDDESEDKWREIVKRNTPAEILRDISGLDVGSELSNMIINKREELVKTMKTGAALPV